VRLLRADHKRRLAEERAAIEDLPQPLIQVPWLELALGVAVLILVIQCVPAAHTSAMRIVDVTRWSRMEWFLFNLLVVALLILFRFRVDLCRTLQTRLRRTTRVVP